MINSPGRLVVSPSGIVNEPFDSKGGLKVLKGNLGIAVVKTSAVEHENRRVEAEAIVFTDQGELIQRFKNGELDRDFIAVLPFQGPKQKGMPELHKLTPTLTVLQKRGYRVGLVTDGRMSGASGKVPAAIHVSPEACDGGVIGKIQDGDVIRLDAEKGVLECTENIENRPSREVIASEESHGRDLFQNLRKIVGKSEDGAGIL